MTTKIFGVSDDLIEIEGDIRDEVGMYDTSKDKPCWLNLSDGTKMKVYYDERGVWRTEIVIEGTLFDFIDKTDADPDSENYTEFAYFKDGLTHFMVGEDIKSVTIYGDVNNLREVLDSMDNYDEGYLRVVKDW